MDKFKIINLPRLSFAHIFGADNYHRNFPAREGLLEITYISKGSLPSIRGGVRYDAAEGDVTCDFFDLPQRFEADAPHEHHTVGFYMDFCPSNDGIFIPYLTKSTHALAPIRERIDEIIRRKTIAPEDDITLAGLFLTLVGELADYHKTRISCPQFSPHVERAKRYISAHLHEPISQKQLALELCITPEYLCAIFKKSEGESIIHYANRMKLATICAILQNEQIPLSEAAAMYGYADPNYVSRLYKSYFGRTISESIRQSR